MPLSQLTGPTTVTCQGESFELYISAERIRRRLEVVGHAIEKRYAGKTPILIGVLNGAFMVLSDLIRTLKVDCEIDFLKLSSYGARKVSKGEVTELKRVDADLTGRDVIVVEDIVDTGLSMQYLLDRIEEHEPNSVRTFTLLHKPSSLQHDVSLDYVGFEVPDRFVIGYGMDYGQVARNLPHIYIRKADDEKMPPAVEPKVLVPAAKD